MADHERVYDSSRPRVADVACDRLSHYRYRDHRYKNQPLKIEDYEPGFHSSIAHKQAKTVSTTRLPAEPLSQDDLTLLYSL